MSIRFNPHNAEFNKNSEEQKIIVPIVKMLRQRGLKLMVHTF